MRISFQFCIPLLIASVTLLPNSIDALKIGIFVVSISGSQIIYNIRVAELLANAGHNVTLIRTEFDPKANNIRSKKENIREIRINGVANASAWQEMKDIQAYFLFREMSIFSVEARRVMTLFRYSFIDACETQITNAAHMNQLQSEHFDVAISHMYDFCAIGIIHHLNIKGWIWLSSGTLLDSMAIISGAPSPPSYVPGSMTDMSDRMSFWERSKNFFGLLMTMILVPRLLIDPETQLFRQHIDADFPNLASIAATCPLIMANSDELFDFPRPILHKIVYVGGIGMSSGKELEGDYKTIVESHERIIIMSFGSIANETIMPIEWKEAIIGAFRHFSDVYFIWKYEIDDIKHLISTNVYLTPWLPQKDLLHHKNVKGFITHGGFNSLQEAINSGTPIITIPLFADQYRNGRIAEKHRFGIDIIKTEFSQQKLIDAISQLLNDKSYTLAVQRLDRMIRKKPVPAEHLMIRWVEFIGEFQQLSELRVAAIDLNIIEYFCIDVMFVLFAIVSTIVYIIYRLLRIICCYCDSRVLYGPRAPKQKLS